MNAATQQAMENVDLTNRYNVRIGENNGKLYLGSPLSGSVTPEQALAYAAWIVTLAQDGSKIAFVDILQQVQERQAGGAGKS